MTGEEQYELLRQFWAPRARFTQEVHYFIATRYAAFHKTLSTCVVVLSAVTASTLFATLSRSPAWKLLPAILSLVAALLSGIDRTSAFASKSEQHRQAGALWSPIVNDTEKMLVQLPHHPSSDTEIDRLDQMMDETTRKSPYIPERYFNRFGLGATYVIANKTVSQRGHNLDRDAMWPLDRHEFN